MGTITNFFTLSSFGERMEALPAILSLEPAPRQIQNLNAMYRVFVCFVTDRQSGVSNRIS